VANVCQPSTLRIMICPQASGAQNNVAAVSADGSTICVLMRRLRSSCSRSIAFVVLALFHWLDLLWRGRVDHVDVIGSVLFVQPMSRRLSSERAMPNWASMSCSS
jgi:hypothetical protein